MEPLQIVQAEPPADHRKRAANSLVNRLKEATEFAQAAIAASQQRQEDAANARRRPAERFEVGDKV